MALAPVVWCGHRPIACRAEPPAAAKGPVREYQNISYRDREPGEWLPGANLLDLYLPPNSGDCPVVVLVHGGAWVAGDKVLDFIPDVARCLARHGVAVAAPNYRLSAVARYPANARDVARAVAWVHDHIGEYGGRGDRLFLMGHSAGGHLVSLLATDETFLKEVRLSRRDIKGVISVSGVYQISAVCCKAVAAAHRTKLELTATANPYSVIFGRDAEAGRRASPLAHVQRGLPPFLVLYAERDLPTLADMAVQFDAALREHGCQGRLLKVPDRNHVTVLWGARHDDDPVLRAVVGFVHPQSQQPSLRIVPSAPRGKGN
jgi:acetyl esterase/lipase